MKTKFNFNLVSILSLIFVYIQTGNKGNAQQTAFKLRQLDSKNPNYQELFKNLGI